jgi:hypothetical protein
MHTFLSTRDDAMGKKKSRNSLSASRGKNREIDV